MKRFVLIALTLACARAQSAQNAAPARTVDILIRGGTVVDGSGGAPYAADVGIAGDRITFVGDARRERVAGARTIVRAGSSSRPGSSTRTRTRSRTSRRASGTRTSRT
jgi:adenine deaminase